MTEPLWCPSPERAAATEIMRWAVRHGFEGSDAVDRLWRWSVENPAEFWREVWERFGMRASRRPDAALENGDGRSDAVLNPGGVRIGTAEIYRQVEQIEEVQEAPCCGQDWQGDVRVILFVRLRDGAVLDDALKNRIRRRIREGASPRHVPARIIPVADIPRTLSGKIVELAVREVIHGRPVKNIEALANPQALELYKDLPELRT